MEGKSKEGSPNFSRSRANRRCERPPAKTPEQDPIARPEPGRPEAGKAAQAGILIAFLAEILEPSIVKDSKGPENREEQRVWNRKEQTPQVDLSFATSFTQKQSSLALKEGEQHLETCAHF